MGRQLCTSPLYLSSLSQIIWQLVTNLNGCVIVRLITTLIIEHSLLVIIIIEYWYFFLLITFSISNYKKSLIFFPFTSANQYFPFNTSANILWYIVTLAKVTINLIPLLNSSLDKICSLGLVFVSPNKTQW